MGPGTWKNQGYWPWDLKKLLALSVALEIILGYSAGGGGEGFANSGFRKYPREKTCNMSKYEEI